MTDLLALADRVEKATGPDRELVSEIYHALGWTPCDNPTFAGGLVGRWVRPDGTSTGHEGPPNPMASLDAAMTLVPRGWDWAAGTAGFGRGGHAFMRTAQAMTSPGPGIIVDAATPALALVAAALRARHAEIEERVE